MGLGRIEAPDCAGIKQKAVEGIDSAVADQNGARLSAEVFALQKSGCNGQSVYNNLKPESQATLSMKNNGYIDFDDAFANDYFKGKAFPNDTSLNLKDPTK